MSEGKSVLFEIYEIRRGDSAEGGGFAAFAYAHTHLLHE